MKKLALLALVALEICLCACGNTPPTSTILTQSGSSNWEAQLTGGEGQDSLLNFITTFSIDQNAGTLGITAFDFINTSECFPSSVQQTASGSASLTTNSSLQVTGTMTFTVTAGTTTLTLNGNVTGTSNGTTSTTGTLSNGVVQGTWYLASSETGCTAVPQNQAQPFLMCQGAATCTVP